MVVHRLLLQDRQTSLGGIGGAGATLRRRCRFRPRAENRLFGSEVRTRPGLHACCLPREMPLVAAASPETPRHGSTRPCPALRRDPAAVGLTLPATQQAQARSALGTAPFSFAPLVKQVVPAVVNIAVTESVAATGPVRGPAGAARHPVRAAVPRQLQRNRREQVMGAGSGFVIDPSGIIVTNNHVVGHADSDRRLALRRRALPGAPDRHR